MGAIVVALGAIGTCAAYVLAPRGEHVGAMDLMTAPTLTFDLARRSALSFRLDATLPAPTGGDSARARRNEVYDTLGASRIVLTLRRQGAAPRVVRCPAYEGRFVTADDTASEVSVRGIPLSCALAGEDAGQALQVSAEVVWARGVRARRATIELRASPE